MIRLAPFAVLLALCAAAVPCSAQVRPGADAPRVTDAPPVTPSVLPGWTAQRTETYRGRALYGYMDGGAELYYEYGFDSLVAFTATSGTRELTIEAFRMASPEAAFGIFSATGRFAGCTGDGPSWVCASPGAVALHRGCWYVAVRGIDTGRQGLEETQHVVQVSATAAAGGDAPPPALFRLAAREGCERAVLLLAGPVSANAAAAEYADVLEGLDGARLWLARCGGRDIGLFLPAGPAQAGGFLERFIPGVYPEAGARWKCSRAGSDTRAVRAEAGGGIAFVRGDGKDPGMERFLKRLR